MSLILIDGSALIYRAHYAFAGRPLTAPGGETVSVCFGFLNSVLRLVETRRPTHLGIVFDLPVPTFRHRRYAAYKATRKPMPEELAAQLPRLRELIAAWGVGVCELAGWEGDDVMATLARRSANVCRQVWFYTGDKDFLQLLDARTGQLKPGRRGDEVSELTPDTVRRDFGLAPRQLIDVFALSGDASDNIPGAPGIGEKTGLQLIQRFGGLDALYARLDDASLTPRLRRILDEHREQVYLSRELFTIDCDAPVSPDWEAMRVRLPVGEAARELMRGLGLRQLLALVDRMARSGLAPAASPAEALIEPASPAPAVPAPRGVPGPGDEGAELARRGYIILHSDKLLRAYLAKLPEGSPVAVDTETDGLRPDRARLVGISLCAPGAPPAWLPVLERDAGDGAPVGAAAPLEGTLFAPAAAPPPPRNNLPWITPLLGPVLADPARLKIGQNLKFDAWLLARHGLPLGGNCFDTMVAAGVLEAGRPGLGLDDLARTHLGESLMPYAALFAAGDRQRDILAVPRARLALYAAEDAEATLRLHDRFAPALAAEPALERLFRDVEMPLLEVLLRMERNGIRVDIAFLGVLRARFAEEMGALEVRIAAAAGEPFNVNSPQQLARVLFDKLGLRPTRRTATGFSTDVGVLTELAELHPLPGLVLEFRQLAKLQGTYVESLPALADPVTGLVHTSYHQAVAATGRLSSSDPNLQNIPIRTELGRMIRRAFVPRAADHLFISADYSQIELRLLAHFSGDAALTAAFREGGDVHRRTAALIAGVSESEVSGEMRRRAKAINFGVIYGMGARALARQTGVTTREAAQFIEGYFGTYPGVRVWLEATRAAARSAGYVTTLLGRRRRLPEITSPNDRQRSLAERMAVNTPIQGTAADLIKLAMIRLDRELRSRRLASRLLLQVHDELLVEVPAAEAEAVVRLMRDCMESVWELTVPLTVEVHQGANWAEAHG
jgi:DNA polymerase-1